jgi:translation initiation factor IF-2
MSSLFRRRRRGSKDAAVAGEDSARRVGESRRTAENAARGEESEQASRSRTLANEKRREASDAEARRQADENETRRQASDAEARRQAGENEARHLSQDRSRDAGDIDGS